MGASIWLIVLIPLLPIVFIFNSFADFYVDFANKKQAEIVLPYDESKDMVWKYDNKDDFYIDFVEVRVEEDEQIFVFRNNEAAYDDVVAKENKIGSCMDLIFTDKNGNTETYYADIADYGTLVFYKKSECFITEYTAIPNNPGNTKHWIVDNRVDRVLIQPINYDTEVTFTIVCMPDDVKAMKRGDNYAFVPGFDYVKENGGFSERVGVFYELIDGKLQIKDERWTIIH